MKMKETTERFNAFCATFNGLLVDHYLPFKLNRVMWTRSLFAVACHSAIYIDKRHLCAMSYVYF